MNLRRAIIFIGFFAGLGDLFPVAVAPNPALSTNPVGGMTAPLQLSNAAAAPAPFEKPSPGNGYHSHIEKNGGVEKWVQVDLGAIRSINQVNIIPAQPVDLPDTPGFGFPRRFTVEISSHADFRMKEIIVDLTGGDFEVPTDKPFTVMVNEQKARYVRVTAKKLWERTGDYVFALAELQVFSGKTNVALGARVTALDSIEAGRWSRNFLVDGYSSRVKLENSPDAAKGQKNRDKLQRQRDESKKGTNKGPELSNWR